MTRISQNIRVWASWLRCFTQSNVVIRGSLTEHFKLIYAMNWRVIFSGGNHVLLLEAHNKSFWWSSSQSCWFFIDQLMIRFGCNLRASWLPDKATIIRRSGVVCFSTSVLIGLESIAQWLNGDWFLASAVVIFQETCARRYIKSHSSHLLHSDFHHCARKMLNQLLLSGGWDVSQVV